MAVGFKLSDGRDLSDIFTAGDAGITVGFKTSNGTDLGRQFMGGSTGYVTGFRDPSGIDLGSRFGDGPSEASGRTKITAIPGIFFEFNGYRQYFVAKDSNASNRPLINIYELYETYRLQLIGTPSDATVTNVSYIWVNNTEFVITRRDGDSTASYAYAEGQSSEAQAAYRYFEAAYNSKTAITVWYK